MQDIAQLNKNKEKIIYAMRLKGPSLPVHLARIINQSPLFTSAFLSELYKENKIKMSNMRVGNSPLYYIKGQKHLLEKFVEHLNQKERQAFDLLKEGKILSDEKQEPAIRVALRAIKDFAIPVKVRINNETKLFWKYFSLPDEQIKSLIQLSFHQKRDAEHATKHSLIPSAKQPPILSETAKPKVTKKLESNPPIQITKKTKLNRTKTKENKFANNIREYLKAKDMEILSILSEKKKELVGKVRIDTLFGKQSYYLIAKDKKKISQDDLNLALQKSQAEKMPALFISQGNLDKKALTLLNDWQNLIKFENPKI